MKVRKDYDIDIGLWYLNHANSYHIVQNPSRVIPPENIFVGSGSIDDLIGEGHEWYDDIVFLMDSSETINKVRYTKECVALEEEIYRIINALRDDPLATSEEPDAIQKFMKTPDFSTLFKYYATMYTRTLKPTRKASCKSSKRGNRREASKRSRHPSSYARQSSPDSSAEYQPYCRTKKQGRSA